MVKAIITLKKLIASRTFASCKDTNNIAWDIFFHPFSMIAEHMLNSAPIPKLADLLIPMGKFCTCCKPGLFISTQKLYVIQYSITVILWV